MLYISFCSQHLSIVSIEGTQGVFVKLIRILRKLLAQKDRREEKQEERNFVPQPGSLPRLIFMQLQKLEGLGTGSKT